MNQDHRRLSTESGTSPTLNSTQVIGKVRDGIKLANHRAQGLLSENVNMAFPQVAHANGHLTSPTKSDSYAVNPARVRKRDTKRPVSAYNM